MTDSDEAADDLPQPKDEVPVDPYLDVLLAAFLGDSPEAYATLSLTYGGSVISGDVIPQAAWEEAWVAQLEGAGAQAPAVAALRDALTGLREQRDETRRALREADELPQPHRFVHMRDVRVFNGGNLPARLPLWRGRLEQVDGWALGKLSSG